MDITRTSNTERTVADLFPLQAARQSAEAIADAGAPAVTAVATNNIQMKAVNGTKSAEPSAAEVAQSVEAINKFLKPVANNIEFSVDEDSGTTLVKIIDTETQAILRQIPSKEALSMAKELGKLQGLLVREKA
ncbi:MAG: flagellar protein FlaG [Pseudomonadota bacterium]